MLKIPAKLYYYIRLLSLDIVAGTLAGVVFAGKFLDVDIPRHYYTIMAISVWLIYLIDHLMDGVKRGESSNNKTYLFFHHFKIPIILFSLLLAVFDFRLVLYRLEPEIIQFGLTLAVALFFYFLLNAFPIKIGKGLFMKELWIGVIYVAGIWGGPFLYAGDNILPGQWMVVSAFFLIVISNVLLYSYTDYNSDINAGDNTFTVQFGKGITRIIILAALFLAIIFIFLNILLFDNLKGMQIIILIIMSGVMLLLTFLGETKLKKKCVGCISDAIFLLPLVLLIG
jgi:4-hydroxybenzoate polyprenyltransferase